MDDPDAIAPTSAQAAAYAAEALALGAQAQPPAFRAAYGPDRGQYLETYLPQGRIAGRPILLFFHGGAWISGHPGWLRFMAAPVLAQGAIFVAGTYRLAPRIRWPGQYEDVRDALAMVARDAERWGGDARRIAIGGHSAGGHLASLATLKGEVQRPLACLPISSSFDLRYGDVDLESEAGRVYRYLFAERSQDTEASPITFTNDGAVPFHISWGECDFDRVMRSSRLMVEALRRDGAPVSHAIIPRATHFDTHLALADAANPWYHQLRRTFGTARQPEGAVQ